jgi:hypothetical protein
MFSTNKTIVISLAIIFIIVFYHIQFEYNLKNYNEKFENHIKKLIEELITKSTNLKIENSNNGRKNESFDNNIVSIEQVQKSNGFDDHCVKVRDALFTTEELLRSKKIKKQWSCDILPIFDQGICPIKGHNHFNRLGPVGPKCKLSMESYGLGMAI